MSSSAFRARECRAAHRGWMGGNWRPNALLYPCATETCLAARVHRNAVVTPLTHTRTQNALPPQALTCGTRSAAGIRPYAARWRRARPPCRAPADG
eukprot:scaffold91829_cov60-Phaeocystis_antarctica.AAC.3